MAFVESRGVNIFYEVDGSGPALIFLHGGGGNAAGWWQQIDYFARSYTCVAIDNRGFGRSYPVGPDMTEVARFKEDVFAVMDAEGIERAGLVCQSMGAWTGLRMAMSNPERVWAFVGISSPMGVDHPPAIADAMEFMQSIQESGLGIEDAALASHFREQSPAAFRLYRHLNTLSPVVLQGERLGVPANGVVGGMFSPDIQIPLEDLAAVEVPSLIISGAHDRLVKTDTMRTIADHLGNATLEVFENTGHSPYFESPDEFNELVGRYLTDFLEVDL